MSFVRLDTGEYPPLCRKIQEAHPVSEKRGKLLLTDRNAEDHLDTIKFRAFLNSTKGKRDTRRPLVNFDEPPGFIKARIGVVEDVFREDVNESLNANFVGIHCDFILVDLEPPRKSFYDNQFQALPDFALPVHEWESKVALHIANTHLENFDIASSRHIDKVFKHAMYLPCRLIVVSCPSSSVSQISMASIINERLSCNNSRLPLLLIRVPVTSDSENGPLSSWSLDASQKSNNPTTEYWTKSGKFNNASSIDETTSENGLTPTRSTESGYNSADDKEKTDAWSQWNSIRDHLIPDERIGVALELEFDDDIFTNQEYLDRWLGEPVRMIIIEKNQFVRTPGHNGCLYLNRDCREFIKKMLIANSFQVKLVLKGSGREAKEYLSYLDYFVKQLQDEFCDDELVRWDTVLQTPLQPLSSNLDAGTYGTFEADSIKYIRYGEAVHEAIEHLLSCNSKRQTMVLMVLGAGRGPLVDRTIEAIKAIQTKCRFKIYALDKNSSSVLTLKYRQSREWTDEEHRYQVEVVEADMRDWKPNDSPDIITTELLGSFGDNELSPECIDGLWRFATPETISIPQEYTSYLAPVCTYKLHQKLHRMKRDTLYAFDQIYVTRLINSYLISSPERLFTFMHKDLVKPPVEDQNARYAKLTFWSKTNTVCHGFAGYFSAQLFKGINLSTVPGKATQNMYSWFPIFVPIEQPIQMPKGTRLEVHFWRKESASQVWYQWGITHPIKSRIYSVNGLNTAMSKSI